ncbi:MAG: hypothetical protein V1810_02230 [Candidatus Beckwithbacteria bacterium]
MLQGLLLILSIVGGAAIGWLMPIFDYVAYVYILHPEAQISQYLKYEIVKKQFKPAWETVKRRRGEFDKLTTRGILFQLVWVVLAVFAITSTTGWFGKSLIMGLGFRVLVEEISEWRKDRASLKKKLLWQVEKEWADRELKLYLGVKAVIFAWLIWAMI